MSKANDFTSDLEMLSASVDAEVGTIMKAIEEQKTNRDMATTKKAAPPATVLPNGEGRESDAANGASAPDSALRASSRSRPRPKPSLAEQIVMQNVTTRLRRETNELLTEAALRQRLKKDFPATRQDIVEEALQHWLRRHGYGVDGPN